MMLNSNLDGNTVILLAMLQQNYEHQLNLSEYVQKNIPQKLVRSTRRSREFWQDNFEVKQ